jgi:probable F420-dependent oxidoreductase
MSAVRPRIGVSSLMADAASWPDWCRQLEAAGVDEISAADHLQAGVLPPLAALAAAATVTERVSLSTMVLNNELRHPAVLANEVATISELSGGRFTLGIGAGHAEDEHDAIGQPLPPPPERVARLEEAVVALRRLLAGERVTTSGPSLRLADVVVSPTPSQPVPVLVGGGSRAVLRVAARHADIVGLTGFSHIEGTSRLTHFSDDALAARMDLVRGLPRERDEPLAFQALVQLLRITDDRAAAADALMAEWGDALTLTREEVLATPFLLLGSAEEIAAQLHERSDRLGIGTWTVFAGRPIDPTIDDLRSVVEALDR